MNIYTESKKKKILEKKVTNGNSWREKKKLIVIYDGQVEWDFIECKFVRSFGHSFE